MLQSWPGDDTPAPVGGGGWADLTDAALVQALVHRHHQALAEVHRRHAEAVGAFVRRLSRSAAFEQDVVQEVFLRLWLTPANFDADRGSLRTYLFAIARGRAVDLIRSDGSRRSRESRDALLRRGETEAESVAEAGTGAALDPRVLRRLLEELPEPERAPIELAFFHGLNYRAVADRLGVPEGTTKSRIRRGLRRLRRRIEREPDGPSAVQR
jgi:RNA polymerase sigma-70 factor, ECF subfamily